MSEVKTELADEERPDSPWDGAELVIYTTDEEDAEHDPCTEWGRGLGVVSFSLWARYADKATEIPIYSASETGVWMSMSSEQFHPTAAEPVSDAFIESVVNMVDEDVGEGWGDPTKESFEAMSLVERQIWGSLRWAFLKVESPEAAMVIDWCQKQFTLREIQGENQ